MRTRTALLACLVGLVPALATAQAAGQVLITESSDTAAGGLSDQVINIAECDGTVASDSLTLQWTWGVATLTTANYFRVYASTAACPTTGTAPVDSATIHELGNATFNQVPANSTGGSGPNPAINVRTDLVQNLSALTCRAAATVNFCVLVFDGNVTASTIQNGAGASGTIRVEVAAPGQPTSVSASSGDGALTVGWVAGSGTATTWRVTATPAAADPALGCTGGGAGGSRDCTGSSTTSCRITGLTNDACYSVTVQGFSEFNNPSPVSVAATGVPRPVEDFWERYGAGGGREQGGCGGGPAAALSLLALAVLAPRLLRRRP